MLGIMILVAAVGADPDADAAAAIAIAKAARERTPAVKAEPAPAAFPAQPKVIERAAKAPPGIAWREYDAARAAAAKSGKPLFVLFTDPKTCVPCKAFAKAVLGDKDVIADLARLSCARIDVTTPDGKAFADTCGVGTWPSFSLSHPGKADADWHLGAGEMTATEFRELVQKAKTAKATAAPGVPPGKSFRSPGLHYNPSHRCDVPGCGRTQFVISGPGPVPGTHVHTDSAGHQWFH